jgi:hypothetical protein
MLSGQSWIGIQRSVGIVMQVTETTLFHQQTNAMNEKLLISSVHQHELTEVAEKLNDRLRVEIAERERAAEDCTRAKSVSEHWFQS